MPSYKIVEVLDRQSLWDVAIQEYGSAEGVFALMADNPVEIPSLSALITPEQLLKIRSAPIDKETLAYYNKFQLHPVSIGEEIKLNVGGDYNDDYNEDYY